MGETLYRLGDHVYVEAGASVPYQIRRIEELNATPTGAVNVVVSCFYRRSDVNPSLMEFADEGLAALVADDKLSPRRMTELAKREIFNSNMQETVDATTLRGKCTVIRVSDVESASSYLGKDDVFFFCFSYDPAEKSLCCDDGEIKIGPDHQVDDGRLPAVGGCVYGTLDTVETQIWAPGRLADEEIATYITQCTCIGTAARTMMGGSLQTRSLMMSAASASRDTTVFHALNTLHELEYDIEKALKAVLPTMDAVIVRDELESWSAPEAELFSEGMEKIGKDFYAIRQELLPWKSMKSIVEFYYMWKTTGGYDKTKTAKSIEAKTKLVKILVPNADKRPANNKNNNASNKKCSHCGSHSSVQWSSTQPFRGTDVCLSCWEHWKKYDAIKK